MAPNRFNGKHARPPTDPDGLRLTRDTDYDPRPAEDPRGSSTVDISTSHELSRLQALRATFAGLMAGLGALAAGVQGIDEVTLSVGLIAAAAAVTAAGAVYGIRPEGVERPVTTTISKTDLDTMRSNQNGSK